MKLESLVILNQNVRVNTFPGVYNTRERIHPDILIQDVRVNTFPGVVHTARHAMEVGNTRRW